MLSGSGVTASIVVIVEAVEHRGVGGQITQVPHGLRLSDGEEPVRHVEQSAHGLGGGAGARLSAGEEATGCGRELLERHVVRRVQRRAHLVGECEEPPSRKRGEGVVPLQLVIEFADEPVQFGRRVGDDVTNSLVGGRGEQPQSLHPPDEGLRQRLGQAAELKVAARGQLDEGCPEFLGESGDVDQFRCVGASPRKSQSDDGAVVGCERSQHSGAAIVNLAGRHGAKHRRKPGRVGAGRELRNPV